MGGGTDGVRHASVSVLNANRNVGRWNGNVNRLGNDNRWNVENRLLLCNCLLSLPGSSLGSFLFDIFHPSDKHLARLYEWSRQAGVLLVSNHRDFPAHQ